MLQSISEFQHSLRILRCKMRVDYGRCSHGKRSLKEAFET